MLVEKAFSKGSSFACAGAAIRWCARLISPMDFALSIASAPGWEPALIIPGRWLSLLGSSSSLTVALPYRGLGEREADLFSESSQSHVRQTVKRRARSMSLCCQRYCLHALECTSNAAGISRRAAHPEGAYGRAQCLRGASRAAAACGAQRRKGASLELARQRLRLLIKLPARVCTRC